MADSPLEMKRDLQTLASTEFDLVVVGGGIFGACAAWDAVLRGLSVALVERNDFGSGASANSFKFVHGGIRYLQHADLRRLRQSSRERRAFLKIAPHLVHPLPIVIPTYGHLQQGRAFLAAGMLLYDVLTLDRNLGFTDRDRKIPLSRFLSRSHVLSLFPNLPSENLTGGAAFCDGQMYNPTRLVLAFVQSAVNGGAVVSNYVEASGFIENNCTVSGIAATDRISGDTFDIRAKVTLNAAGPWAEGMLRSKNRAETISRGIFSRDACFVVPRKFDHSFALAVAGQTKDPDAIVGREGRHLFAVPWRDHTLIGVWHVVYDENPDEVTVDDGDLQSFIDEMNWAYPALKLQLNEVTCWNAGLVPFGENQPGSRDLSYGKESRIIDHSKESGIDGLVTLIGIRYTMGRSDAAKAIDMVAGKLGRKLGRSITQSVPVCGGEIECVGELIKAVKADRTPGLADNAAEALVRNYGTAYGQILRLAEERPELLESFRGSTVLKAEVINAIRHEMALTLPDVVFRRTDLATGQNPGADVLRQCAHIIAAEAGWDEPRIHGEIESVMSRFRRGVPIATASDLANNT